MVITEQSHWLQMLLHHMEQSRFFMKALLLRSVWTDERECVQTVDTVDSGHSVLHTEPSEVSACITSKSCFLSQLTELKGSKPQTV